MQAFYLGIIFGGILVAAAIHLGLRQRHDLGGGSAFGDLLAAFAGTCRHGQNHQNNGNPFEPFKCA